jgi:hypothetical protein
MPHSTTRLVLPHRLFFAGAVPGLLLAAITVPTSAAMCPSVACAAEAAPPAGPHRPTHCRATLFSFSGLVFVHLTWDDRSNDELGFTVERWVDGTLVAEQTMPANASESSFLVSAFGPSGQFRVRAFNLNGTSRWSNWASP